MKTKTLTQKMGLILILLMLTHNFTNAQIQIRGLAIDNEGIACWDADGSGLESEAYGHDHPFGWGSSLYYAASRDYVTMSHNAYMCHFLDNISGFPLFEKELENQGFTPAQVKMRYGLSKLKEDIKGEDWFTIDAFHSYNRYGAKYTILLNNEPMLSCDINFTNVRNIESGTIWHCETNYSSPYDVSGNSSTVVQAVAAALLADIGAKELRIIMNCTGHLNFEGNGRVNGTYFNITSGRLEKGLPEMPFSGLAKNREGLACWDADGTGPEPEARGHSFSWKGVQYSYPYYIASRDYDGIDPYKNAACGHFINDFIGFPNLKSQLIYRGYTLDQLKIKTGLGSLGNDIKGIDWGMKGSIHWYNYYGFDVIIEIGGEPILQYILDTNYCYRDMDHLMKNWWSVGSHATVIDISATASKNAKYVAQSFLRDLGRHTISSYMEGHYSGYMKHANGRVSGVFHEVEHTKLIAMPSEGTHISGGEVSGKWYLARSPYIITGAIEIPDGKTLTIQPGVVIKFYTPEVFRINGCLDAQGTEENPILFTALHKSIRWGGILWDKTPVTNAKSILTHCILEYAYSYNNENLPGYNSGGAIAVLGYENIEICQCVFRYNLADNPGAPGPKGGAIFLDESSLYISHCIFHDNQAKDAGAIALFTNSNAIIDNCLFYNNMALSGFGGAIMTENNCNPHIVNCTFADNYASRGGGAVNLKKGGTASFTNSIFWSNRADIGPDQIIVLDTEVCKLNVLFCNVEGGLAGITPNFEGGYVESIDDNPRFVDFEDYRYVPDVSLGMVSKCINGGTMASVFLPNNWICPDCCLCGNPRFVGSGIDMGCYESDFITKLEQKNNNKTVLHVIPNPINSNPTIEFTLQNEDVAQLSILDIHGRVIFEMELQNLQKGKNQVSWKADEIPAGLYFCQLQTGNKISSTKFIKLD